jgi:transposase InsO family protein
MSWVMSLTDRIVRMVAVTTQTDEGWMQIGRNLTDCESGVLRAKQYLIIDRDSKYTAQFRRLIQDSGTNPIRLPPRPSNLNAYAERFVRSVKDECLDRMIFVGQASLRGAVREYVEHYHEERNHQGLDSRLIRSRETAAASDGGVRRKERLGGILNLYHREAA